MIEGLRKALKEQTPRAGAHQRMMKIDMSNAVRGEPFGSAQDRLVEP